TPPWPVLVEQIEQHHVVERSDALQVDVEEIEALAAHRAIEGNEFPPIVECTHLVPQKPETRRGPEQRRIRKTADHSMAVSFVVVHAEGPRSTRHRSAARGASDLANPAMFSPSLAPPRKRRRETPGTSPRKRHCRRSRAPAGSAAPARPRSRAPSRRSHRAAC